MNSDNITNLFNNGYQSFHFLLTKISLKIPTFFLFFFEIPYFLLSFLQHLKFLSEQCCHISNFYLNNIVPNCGLYKVGTLVSTVNSSIQLSISMFTEVFLLIRCIQMLFHVHPCSANQMQANVVSCVHLCRLGMMRNNLHRIVHQMHAQFLHLFQARSNRNLFHHTFLALSLKHSLNGSFFQSFKVVIVHAIEASMGSMVFVVWN